MRKTYLQNLKPLAGRRAKPIFSGYGTPLRAPDQSHCALDVLFVCVTGTTAQIVIYINNYALFDNYTVSNSGVVTS